MKKLIAAHLLASLSIFSPLSATTYTWTGDSDDITWNQNGNWSPSTGFPDGADDIAIFPFIQNPQPIVFGGVDRTVKRVIFTGGGSLDIDEADVNSLILAPTTKKQTSIASAYGDVPLKLNSPGNLTISNPRGNVFIISKLATDVGGAGGSLTIASGGGPKKLPTTTFIQNAAGYTSSTIIGGGIYTYFDNADNTFGGDFTVARGGKLNIVSNTHTFSSDFNVRKGGIVSFAATTPGGGLSAAVYNGAVSNSGTISLYGAPTFTSNANFTNSGRFNIASGNPVLQIDSLTNNGRVDCRATSQVNVMSFGVVTNNKRKTITFGGFPVDRDDRPIYGVTGGVNNGRIDVVDYADVQFTTTTFTNNGTFNLYGDYSVAFPRMNPIAAFTNNGTMKLTTGEIVANGLFTNQNKGFLSVTLGASAEFIGGFVNQDRARMTFQAIQDITIGAASSHNGTSRIDFLGLQNVDINNILTNTSTGTINFYGDSVPIFANANSALINSGAGSVNFYGNASATFGNTAPITLTDGSINCYGNSFLSISSAFNLGNGALNVYGNSIVDFQPASTIVDSGTPTASAIKVYGNGELSIQSGTATFTTPISVYQNGILIIENANLTASDITIGNANRKLAGGTLEFEGTTSQAQNVTSIRGGQVLLNSGTTPTINGNYSQLSTSTFGAQLNKNDVFVGAGKTKLTIVGTGALAGHLMLEFVDGHDASGEFTFLESTGGLNGTEFNTFEVLSGETGVTVTYPADAVKVTLAAPLERLNMVMPTSVKTLKGNNRSMAKHLLKSSAQVKKSKDFKKASASITQQSEKYFKKSLGQLQPNTHLAAHKVGVKKSQDLLKDFNRAIDIQRNFQKVFKRENEQKGPSFKAPRNFQNDFFVNAVAASSEVTKVGALNYISKSGGANFGWTKTYPSNWLLEAGFGCLESNLSSLENLGSIDFNSAYFAPTLAYLGDQTYFNLMLITGLTQYDQKREVRLPRLDLRVAQAKYSGLDLGVQIAGGLNFEFTENVNLGIDFAILAQESSTFEYRETGANSLNLTVMEQKMQSVYPSIKLFASHKVYQKGHTLKGSIYLNASSDLYLTDGVVQSHLSFLDKEDAFKTRTLVENTTKATLGADMSYKASKSFECLAHIESEALKGFKESSAELKFNWLF